MSVRLGKEFPEFSCETSHGPINSFHEWIGDSWGILFSHPADFTPVCTTELSKVAQLAPEFARHDVKLIALSVDTAESHREWIKDIVWYGNTQTEEGALRKLEIDSFPYPIIDDSKRILISLLGMEDPDELNADGIPLTCRAVFIIGPDKRLKASLLYPATSGRNFSEILRLVHSLKLTARQSLATPADWRPSQKCMVIPKLTNEQALEQFNNVEILDPPSGKPYLRLAHPKAD